ncbi:MAG TPA: hypothetical protein VMC10_25785 [Stellaceae bacterium]|nr:hypothetical protein [Stellaceae bacterium]
MRYGKTAALTGNLLFPKGNAETVGFLLSRQPQAVVNQSSVQTLAAPAPVQFTPAPRQFHTEGPVRHSIMLDRERHMRLKLASVKLNTSGRELILAALDHYFSTVVPARLGHACPCLVADPTTDATCGGDNCRVVTEPKS